MKTSHQLAHELLAGPDLPISICDPHADEREDVCHDPKIALIEGFDDENGGDAVEMLELYGNCPVLAPLYISSELLDAQNS